MIRHSLSNFPRNLLVVGVTFLFLTVLMPSFCIAKERQEPLPAHIAKGLMLFELYKGDYFDAIIRSPDTTTEQLTLDLAHSLSEFGLNDQAGQFYDQLQSTGTAESKSIAYFQLGKAAYNRGEWTKALDWFNKPKSQLSKDMLSELHYYQANAYIKLKQYTKAAAILGKMKEGAWASYAYYNLGIAYSEIDSEPTRAIISLRVADALNTNKVASLAELKDQTLLAAGYLSIQAEDYEKALSFLNQVRVDSDLASKALYMHGVANSSQERYRAAIQSWYRVKKYPLINPGVADAFLAIPFAYDKEGYSSKSISSYLEAISVFDKESRNIDIIIAAVLKNGARSTFFGKSALDDIEWFLSDSIATNTPKVAYLKYIMSDSQLHQLAKQSIELAFLDENLSLWEHNLSVYDEMLKQRISGYYQRIKKADTSSRAKRINNISNEASKLKISLATAEQTQDVLSVAAGRTLRRLESVKELDKTLLKIKKDISPREFDDLKQRIKRLDGLVMWEASEQYERNLRLTQETLRVLDKEVERYKKGLEKFEGLIAKGPVKLESFKKRVSNFKKKIIAKKQELNVVRKQQDKALTEQVITVLQAKKIEFVAHHETAQQRLAHLYEYVAMVQHSNKQRAANRSKQKKASRGGAK